MLELKETSIKLKAGKKVLRTYWMIGLNTFDYLSTFEWMAVRNISDMFMQRVFHTHISPRAQLLQFLPPQFHPTAVTRGCFPNSGEPQKPQRTANQQKVGLQWHLRLFIPLSPNSLSMTLQRSSKNPAWAFMVSIPGVCVCVCVHAKAASPYLTSLCLTAFQGLNPDKACLDLSLLAHNQGAGKTARVTGV